MAHLLVVLFRASFQCHCRPQSTLSAMGAWPSPIAHEAACPRSPCCTDQAGTSRSARSSRRCCGAWIVHWNNPTLSDRQGCLWLSFLCPRISYEHWAPSRSDHLFRMRGYRRDRHEKKLRDQQKNSAAACCRYVRHYQLQRLLSSFEISSSRSALKILGVLLP